MFAFVTMPERGAADRLLAQVCDRGRAAGYGFVAMVDAQLAPDCDCDMTLRLLPDDVLHPISQDLGSGADACSLDVGALELAVAHTAGMMAALPDAPLILNKFGKIESGGRGCCSLIAQALDEGRRVLISVPDQTRAEFDAFSGGFAHPLPADEDVLFRFLWADGKEL